MYLSVVLICYRSNADQTLQLFMFDEADEPLAVCNDGTPGGYYFAPASQPEYANDFLIFLPGGGQCYDEASCTSRSSDMMSSDGLPTSKNVTGILDASPEQTPLYGANKAYLVYCSSDGYMGNIGASNATWGFHFRGQALVQAMVKALSTNHGLASAERIYFVGCSAGARGVMTNIDPVVEMGFFPANAMVIAYLDSPYYLDVQPYSADFLGFQYQEQQKYSLFNTTGIISADCAAAFVSDEQWKCQYGEYRMEYVKAPYFIVASQYDSYQLSLNTQLEPNNYDAGATQYAEEFGAHDTQSLISLLEHTGNAQDKRGDGFAYFSWACYNHAIADHASFNSTSTTNGVTQKQALEVYLAMHPASSTGHIRTLQWVDDCSGFDCGSGCT